MHPNLCTGELMGKEKTIDRKLVKNAPTGLRVLLVDTGAEFLLKENPNNMDNAPKKAKIVFETIGEKYLSNGKRIVDPEIIYLNGK